MSNHLTQAAIDLFRKPKRVKVMPSSPSAVPPLTRQRWLEEILRVRRKEVKPSGAPTETPPPPPPPPPPLRTKATGLFSLARWRRHHPNPNDTPRETTPAPSPCPTISGAPAPAPALVPSTTDIEIEIDTDTDWTATEPCSLPSLDPHSLPAPTSTSGQGSSSSVNKKTPVGVGRLLDEMERAPPAGEKGRFIEHVPEANHEQWRSQLSA
ncbi:hypothetical protein APHAL10511_000823 [Amanita phalloides]|nr:hypothetical protein APHAL10511_000823 [Amanita phalloides]